MPEKATLPDSESVRLRVILANLAHGAPRSQSSHPEILKMSQMSWYGWLSPACASHHVSKLVMLVMPGRALNGGRVPRFGRTYVAE